MMAARKVAYNDIVRFRERSGTERKTGIRAAHAIREAEIIAKRKRI